MAATLRATGATVLPVLFTAAAPEDAADLLQSSVPGGLLALAMHRVLQRRHHAGALSGCSRAHLHACNGVAAGDDEAYMLVRHVWCSGKL